MPLHTHVFSFTHNAVVLSTFQMCSPRKSNENFLIFTFYESKQMSLTQDLRWSLGRSIALQLQRQTDLLLCTINCFLQWDHLPNMAVGDLAFYYTLYLWKSCKIGLGKIFLVVCYIKLGNYSSWQHNYSTNLSDLLASHISVWTVHVPALAECLAVIIMIWQMKGSLSHFFSRKYNFH